MLGYLIISNTQENKNKIKTIQNKLNFVENWVHDWQFLENRQCN